MNEHLRRLLLATLLIIIQTTVIEYLSVMGIKPDILLIFIVYIAITKGQITGTIYGFIIGFIFDLVSGGVLGISSLCKTIAGFVSGYFYNENKIGLTLSSYRFLLILILISFLHNIIYFLIFLQGSEVDILSAILKLGLTTTLYTSAVSIFIVLFSTRKYTSKING